MSLLTSLRLRIIRWLTDWLQDPYAVAGDAEVEADEPLPLCECSMCFANRTAVPCPPEVDHFVEDLRLTDADVLALTAPGVCSLLSGEPGSCRRCRTGVCEYDDMLSLDPDQGDDVARRLDGEL